MSNLYDDDLAQARTKLCEAQIQREKATMLFMKAGVKCLAAVAYLCAAKAARLCTSSSHSYLNEGDVDDVLTKLEK